MESPVTIRDLPRLERPRERFALCGPEALSAYELLAIVLGNGIKGESAILVAQRTLKAFANLRGLSQASIEELSRLKGIGLVRAIQIKAAFELGKRIERDEEEKFVISGPADVARLMRPRLNHNQKESFILLCLDARNAVKRISPISIGTLDSSVIHPREVFKEAVQCLASAIILVHNHPSGNPDPSPEDAAVTRRMIDAGSIIGIRVLDHVITAQQKYYSFQEHGFFGCCPS